MAQTATQPVTAEQLLERSSEHPRCELVRGELIEMNQPTPEHGMVAMRVGSKLLQHVDAYELGKVLDPGGFLLTRNPDTVRSPDVAFIQQARLGPCETTFFDGAGAPNLAVEVVSPDDSSNKVAAKVEDYLTHGCPLVWVVEPSTRTITVYHPDGTARVHHENETLDGGEVLPGFAMRMADIFP